MFSLIVIIVATSSINLSSLNLTDNERRLLYAPDAGDSITNEKPIQDSKDKDFSSGENGQSVSLDDLTESLDLNSVIGQPFESSESTIDDIYDFGNSDTQSEDAVNLINEIQDDV